MGNNLIVNSDFDVVLLYFDPEKRFNCLNDIAVKGDVLVRVLCDVLAVRC
jgi:hypothetical protein